MNILGLSAFYHDSAAALLRNGKIIAAAQEERFTRIKHDHHFPTHAVDYCLKEGQITAEQLDYVVFYDKPLLKFERLLETYLAYAPRGFKQFFIGIPLWLKQKLHLPREMSKALDKKYNKPYVFCLHHESHAASAFFPSPFDEAAILTFDGVGEWATASFGYGQGNNITLTHELNFPHSLGFLYSAFTYFAGFKVNSGEYKLMGLAPYGKPKYYDLIMENLLDLKEDGSFQLGMSYFAYGYDTVMTSRKFADIFGGPPRKAEQEITQREMDMAASVQRVTEEVILKATKHIHRQTGMKNLVLAGGVALNCVANGRVVRESPFEKIWIQPAAGDAGGALGAALFTWHQLLGHERHTKEGDSQQASLLGPLFTNDQIRSYLDSINTHYHYYEDENELVNIVSENMANQKVTGWFQGRMEFGPRALGNRSILGDARSEAMQSTMNLKIKFRESFRPFAPCVLSEDAAEYFEINKGQESPYMLLVADVREAKRIKNSLQTEQEGFHKLKLKRSVIPAVTHVDYSARIQTVDKQHHPRLHKMIKSFKQKTGCPVIINTSFNIRGEPIVCSPQDAYRCFMGTHMDVLVLENFVLYKNEQEQTSGEKMEAYKDKFELD